MAISNGGRASRPPRGGQDARPPQRHNSPTENGTSSDPRRNHRGRRADAGLLAFRETRAEPPMPAPGQFDQRPPDPVGQAIPDPVVPQPVRSLVEVRQRTSPPCLRPVRLRDTARVRCVAPGGRPLPEPSTQASRPPPELQTQGSRVSPFPPPKVGCILGGGSAATIKRLGTPAPRERPRGLKPAARC